MSINEIIEALRISDLKSRSDYEIIELIQKIGKIAVMGVDIKQGRSIIRGRIVKEKKDNSGELEFHRYESQISFLRDKKLIPPYNRASLEGVPMFYGTITDQNEHYSQVLCISEITKLVDENTEDGKDHHEYITMGKWKVDTEFTVCAIAHNEDFHANNEKLADMYNGFVEFVKKHPDREQDFRDISSFIAREFAKKVDEDKRHDYKISAAFSQVMMSYGVAGVLYPTAKDEGKGFNLALPPYIVEKHLKLEKIAVWRLTKRNKQLVVMPYLYCDKFKSDGAFIYEDPGKWISEGTLEYMLSR
ncbi:MAG TPA: hypothetical protein DIS94_08720 [Bacteroidetes bacterium]|nr:hypothetical protein [Bacteroidota bacterium]HRE73670.1 hypothetical protein [Flavobacteriales bacterium]HRE95265.1 hypothetical protein [Flavobacteriales bacterium]HRJ37197.1 hypothetical protein [Flavobacteriales bacterium]